MRFIRRAIEFVLRQFDNEDRLLVVRFRLWRMKWFPYRTAEFLGYDEETLEMDLGPWEWHRPMRLRAKHGKQF